MEEKGEKSLAVATKKKPGQGTGKRGRSGRAKSLEADVKGKRVRELRKSCHREGKRNEFRSQRRHAHVGNERGKKDPRSQAKWSGGGAQRRVGEARQLRKKGGAFLKREQGK